MVAPPTSTTTTSPAPGCSASRPRASSSTAVSTTSGVAPRTIAVKSARCDRCLPPITCAQEHLADRGPRADPGASTPICGHHVVGQRRTACRQPSSSAATSSRASTLPATTTGPAPPGAGQRAGAGQQHLGVAAVGAADEQHDVRRGWRAARAGRRGQAAAGDVHDPAAAGQRDPAAGLGGDQLLVADDGDPQPAAGRRAGQHLARRPPAGRPPASSARQASQPSRTSVSIGGPVARPWPTQLPVVDVDQRRLGERRAEVDAGDRARRRAGLSRGPGRGRRAGRRRSRCRRESRIRSAGTSSSVPATDACVIRPGCSISDSTPPSDSAEREHLGAARRRRARPARRP